MVQGYALELSKVKRPYIRERIIPNISLELASAVAQLHGLGVLDVFTALYAQLDAHRVESRNDEAYDMPARPGSNTS